jgi:hypothetical protein
LLEATKKTTNEGLIEITNEGKTNIKEIFFPLILFKDLNFFLLFNIILDQ